MRSEVFRIQTLQVMQQTQKVLPERRMVAILAIMRTVAYEFYKYLKAANSNF